MKKKVKSKKRVEQADTEEPALKRKKKKKKRQQSEVAEEPWEEVGFPSEANCLGTIRMEVRSVFVCVISQETGIY